QGQQFDHRVTYGQYGQGISGHEVRFTIPLEIGFNNLDQILALIRLPSRWGGNDNVTLPIGFMNDTGSTMQTVFDTDLASLGYNSQTYQGNTGQVYMQTANGVVARESISFEMKLIKPDGT